ncbi:hypothetical protein NLU13_2114 [Sarocladium strictum]|uniref:RNA helicase n=1 Tax=Sarocladium strictum TaxID=5046 RepID=A0AA39GU62_SARSR|nr:hypothetical protein NLU13_2114 [Sarocladium strictum]
MARPRDSRSPSPAGSHHSSRRHRNDDERRDRDRRDGGRRDRHRTRSRSPDVRRPEEAHSHSSMYRRDDYARGDRRDHRDRDRRRSRDRYADKARSPDRRRPRSRDSRDDRDHRRREDSRDRVRDRRDATDPRSRRDDHEPRGTPLTDSGKSNTEVCSPAPFHPKAAPGALTEEQKKAERLAKLEAWKKKKEGAAQKQKDVNPTQTRSLLAEMDMKASGASPAASSPVVSSAASPVANNGSRSLSPAAPYAGKFDPKAIAKKATKTHDGPQTVLGVLDAQPETVAKPVKQTTTASALPANRAKTSGFGFMKSSDTDKLPSKRKLDLDEEDETKRKLTKLPALPIEADDTPYADQDDDDESDGDNFAETEEEAAAAARAAHEKRLQAEQAEADAMKVDEAESKREQQARDEPPAAPQPNGAAPSGAMEVDDEDDVDPLDAFMADLKEPTGPTAPKAPKQAAKKLQEPEAYFSDDEYDFDAEGKEGPDALAAIKNKRRKKDIPTTDYSKLDIQPIRKNFWTEPAELAELTEAEVADLRLELDGIKVKGENVPKPVQKWSQCGLSRQTLDVIHGLGYEKPTPIQMQALPALMSGRDVIGVAKTGSGKTVAFLMPMFRHIKDQPPLKDNEGPVGLIMTPTRELATQIHRDCKPFLKMMGLRAIAELKRGAEIIVCTPGRMIDLLAANQGRVTNLRRVTYVPQVMKIFANMRPDRQTILFSATMPRIIDSLIKKVLKSPVEITVGGRSVVAKEIEQIVEVRKEDTKFHRVLELMGELYDKDEDARTLIFVERQEKADDLLKELLMKGYPCMSIHGGKDQGIVPILIATSLVINYDAPNHLEDYVHRAGRTGRAGNTGVAVTFITPEQENCAPGIAKALEQSGQPVPEDLNEMRKAHREKVKSGKAKDTSGFGGKGLDKLDQEREAARLRERKTHRAEGEEEDEKEEKKDDEEKAEKALNAIRAAASSVQAREAAMIAAATSEIKKTPAAGSDGTSKDPLDKVSSAVSAINSRLGKAGQLRSGQPIDNKGPDAGAYHATLEINDFPQKARWAVTNRTNVAKILEATGTSITTKGSFYPLGKEVPAGADPKLYILIEGDTEVVVSSALTELTRLLREGTIAAADADSRAPASGRYTVT